MIANLITAIGIATSIGFTQPHQPPLKSVIQPNVQYEYDTNEVNTIDDLIVGNIYHYERANNQETTNLSANQFKVEKIYNFSCTPVFNVFNPTNYDNTYTEYSNATIYIKYKFDNIGIGLARYTYEWQVSFDFVLNETIQINNLESITASNYLGNPIITETEGLYNTIENFIETYLYGNDKLRETEYTIMGTTYNMAEWLAHTTTIVLISLIIFVLVMFIKWLFKQIGNTFNLIGVLQ